VVDAHGLVDGIQDGGRNEGAIVLAAALVDDLCALAHGILDQGLEVRWLVGLGQGRDRDTSLPRHAHLERVHGLRELVEEPLGDLY